MALKFGKTKGTAQKKIDSYVYKDGVNTVRIIGDILPRYVYWLKGTNDKDIPVECLAFNRDAEKFDNKEIDHVPKYFPELKCQWNYAVNCIDPTDGKVKVLNLKKKLFGQILELGSEEGGNLGDATDYLDGWDIVFKKVKTGNMKFNVEYTLNVLKCVKRPLSEAEIALADAAETIDQKYPRPTPDEVEATLIKVKAAKDGDDEDDEDGTRDMSGDEKEAVNELQQ